MKLETQLIHGTLVQGIQVNELSGCIHYHSALDIVSIKFKCCAEYYACYWCHHETQHEIQQWKTNEFNEKAILCAACGSKMTIREYLFCESKCPDCNSSFNPGCKSHWDLYFQMA